MSYLTKKEVADKLQVSIRTVSRYMYRENEPIPFIKIGGLKMVRFIEDEVENWIRNS